MAEKKYEKVLILEDDARFSLNFNSLVKYFLTEMNNKNVYWELL